MKRAFFITAALLVVTATSFSAHAASLKSNPTAPGKLGFAAPGGGSTHGHTETCNNIASCNLMISYCAEHGGDWTETGTPGPEGQPQKGKCTYP